MSLSPAAPSLLRVRLTAGPALLPAVGEVLFGALGGPDLSHAILLLADMRAAPGLRRMCGLVAAQRGHALCLPPRILTPDALLAEALPWATIEPAARRAERLYGLVRGHGFFRRESLWETCAAVIAVADELGDAQVSALGEGEWRKAIRAAYRRGAEQADSREARLVWEVWHAEATGSAGAASATDQMDGEPLASTVFSMLAMQAASDNPSAPLFVLQPDRLPKRWQQCFARYSESAPVTMIEVAPPPWVDLVWRDPVGEGADVASAADNADGAGLLHEPLPAVLPQVRIHAADSLESEANAVADQVGAWLTEGITDIGLIALDTLVARRARALLERRQVLLADEAGWRLSTTSAATAVMRWVEAVAGGLPARVVLDFLKSPFVLGDLPDDEREVAVAAIEDAVHRHNIARIGPSLLAVEGLPAEAIRLVQRLLDAQAAWPRGEVSFGTWMAALDASLDQLGVSQQLADDLAGADVLALITQLLNVLGNVSKGRDRRKSGDEAKGMRTSLTEWRIFLAAQFEQASFRNRSVDSPVVLTTLEGAQLRPFQAVLLVGADARHLSASAPDDLFLSLALRNALGLADAAAKRADLHHRLGCLIAMAGQATATWRRHNLDEAQPLSPPLARLELARRLARLQSGVVVPVPEERAETLQAEPIMHQPAPRAPGRLPERISVSSYATLLACPYRFFATALLGLKEPDELEEELSKRDYGTWVHKVLKHFHDEHRVLKDVADDVLLKSLERASDEVFAPLIAFNYLSLGWKLRLQKLFPAYIDWQRGREADGWRYAEGEAPRALAFDLGERLVQLVGRIDRIDRMTGGTGEQAVALIDYKTRRIDELKRTLKVAGEEAQLAGYAMFETALGNEVKQAGLASIDGDAVELAEATIDEPAERQRAEALLRAVEEGSALPANGIERVCSHCQVRGLCRKDYWGQPS